MNGPNNPGNPGQGRPPGINPETGFPPGFEFRRKPSVQNPNPTQTRADNLQDFKAMPGGLKGTPVDLDHHGIPIIDEVPQFSAPPDDLIRERLEMENQKPQRQAQAQQRPPVQQAPLRRPDPFIPPVTNPKYQHPILKKLLEKFGLQTPKVHKMDLYNGQEKVSTFSLTIVPDEVTIWALTDAQAVSLKDGNDMATSWFKLLHACTAVVAIDEEPIYKVMQVQPSPEEYIELETRPLSLSSRLRKVCGKALAQIFWSETLPMGDKLADFYAKKVVSEYQVKSSLDKEGSARFVCPVDDCDEMVELPVRTNPDGSPSMYFCRVHGKELVQTLGDDSPLL